MVEGGDGAGKTTQLALLNEALSARGYRVITTREPGGTEIGEKLRALVLEAGQGTIDDRTEALIFAASRAAHASQLIRPSLAEGAIVLSDRYIDSSAAYQGVGRDLGVETIVDLSRLGYRRPGARCDSIAERAAERRAGAHGSARHRRPY